MAAAKSDQRLQALEAQLAKQATQISEAWQHISTEEAADEAIHEHFAASLDGPRPKTGDSRPSSVQEVWVATRTAMPGRCCDITACPNATTT